MIFLFVLVSPPWAFHFMRGNTVLSLETSDYFSFSSLQSYPSFWPENQKSKKYGQVFTVEYVSHNHYPNIRYAITLHRERLPPTLSRHCSIVMKTKMLLTFLCKHELYQDHYRTLFIHFFPVDHGFSR